MDKLKVLTGIFFVVAIAVSAWHLTQPRAEVFIQGVLPAGEAAEISRVVQHRYFAGRKQPSLLDQLNYRISLLTARVRGEVADRIVVEMAVHRDGTVGAAAAVVSPSSSTGAMYELKRGPKGWEIVNEEGSW